MTDITGKIGPLFPTEEPIEWPMYSYERPAYVLWQAIFERLVERGWSEEKAKNWLQSKEPRWALDGGLGERIAELGRNYVDEMKF